ncbi:MAG: putative DNA binding domain-containing protein [Paludibacter sp.]|nr:putative DNA binding domain-containing protein [Paludibacter sp.]MBP7612456.1 putative DNA binding domain-containing protein [Paludibacter sp.]
MEALELLDIISSGETSKVQFKERLDNQDSFAAEMIAMSNSKGGMIVLGVKDKTGDIVGLDYDQLQRIGNQISTIANESIKPQIFISTEVVSIQRGEHLTKLLIVYVDEGVGKPYKDKNGTIWVKQGGDKRKLTDNNEQVRLFQQSGLLYIDELIVPNTSIVDIKKEKIDDYVGRVLKDKDAIANIDESQLLQNLNVLKNNNLTLGGLLFFAKDPQKYRPAFCIKAISFFGNSIGGTDYRDSKDIIGTIPELFEDGMRFFKNNLSHIQAGQDFNSVGIPEISMIALEELLQNALVHRDYSKNSPIRIMIFDDRIEIVSPGSLPNSLTIENIKMGNAVVRNNLIVTFCSKLMPYRGFGSGIRRALEQQPGVELINDVEGEQFIVRIPRVLK